jgi:hypothetical protein
VISPDGLVTVGVDPTAENAPEPGGGLFAEIFDLLSAIAHEASADAWISEQTEDDEKIDESEARAKYEAVAAAFPAAELIRRTRLRETSTLPVWMSIRWEVVLRTSNSRRLARSTDGRFPFAQVNLTAQGRSRSFFEPDQAESVTFGLDPDDLDDLLRDLKRLRDELGRAGDKNPPDAPRALDPPSGSE